MWGRWESCTRRLNEMYNHAPLCFPVVGFPAVRLRMTGNPSIWEKVVTAMELKAPIVVITDDSILYKGSSASIGLQVSNLTPDELQSVLTLVNDLWKRAMSNFNIEMWDLLKNVR